MAHIKVIKGTTPTFTMTFHDATGAVINPSTAYTLIEVLLYSVASDLLVVKFSTSTPGEGDDWEEITPTATEVDIVFPEAITLAAKSGDNRIEVWTETSDGIIDCSTAIFNEFIDAKNA